MNKKEEIKFISPTITTGTKCISRYSYTDLSYAKIRVAAGGITWIDYVLTFAARNIRKVKQILKTVPPGGQLHEKYFDEQHSRYNRQPTPCLPFKPFCHTFTGLCR